MSTLFFDVMNIFDDDPDWSTSPMAWDDDELADGEDDNLADLYERKLGIGKKSKREVEDYSWLKPPENWKEQHGG